MRKVLSASLAGTALLAFSSLLVLAQTPTPATPPGDATTQPAGGLAALVVGSSAGRRDRGCGLVFYPQANEPVRRQMNYAQEAA